MKVTRVDVTVRTADGNKAPAGGSVWFDDGKVYFFFNRVERVGDEYKSVGFMFGGTRKMFDGRGGTQSFNFKSPAREAALIAALNV